MEKNKKQVSELVETDRQVEKCAKLRSQSLGYLKREGEGKVTKNAKIICDSKEKPNRYLLREEESR